MKKLFCEFCGESIENKCGCEKAHYEQVEFEKQEYLNSSETHQGWAQQDMIDLRRREC